MFSTRRNRGGLAAALLFSLTSCSGGGGGGSPLDGSIPEGSDSQESNPFAGLSHYTGEHVATLEVEAPNSSEFLLHGTVPLPASAYPSADGKKSFVLLDYDDTPILATQVEIVSRYANVAQGADIVEVWARVRKDPALSAGMRLQYRVVEIFYAAGVPAFDDVEPLIQSTLQLPESVQSLIQTPGSVQLRSKDVFGNEYMMDLLEGAGSSQTTQKGAATVQWKHFGALLPSPSVAGSTGTLSQLMGAHSYARVSAQDPILQLDLRISNGAIGSNPDSPTPLSKMYFRDLEIRLPKGFVLVPDVADPFFGTPYSASASTVAYPIVKPNSDGSMHLMPRQGQFLRRFAIVAQGEESLAASRLALEGLGFAREGMNFSNGKQLYSWENVATARYYPQKHPLPHFDHLGQASILSKELAAYTALASILQSGGISPGAYPVVKPVLGAFHGYGSTYGGETGGSGIAMFDGHKTAYAASRHGVLYEMLLQRMWNARQPIALYRNDGEPCSPFDFLKQGSGFQYVPFEYFLNPVGSTGKAFFGTEAAPNFHVSAVLAQGKQPSYEADLLAFMPCDVQHYIRVTGRSKVISYLANDSLAKDDLRLLAHMHWLSFHQFYNNAYQGTQGSGLRAQMNFVAANPNKGFGFGRGEGWGLDAMNAVYGFAEDSWRAQSKPWFDAVADTVAAGQTCNGITMATTSLKMLDGKYRTYQAFEMGIVGNALAGMFSSVYAGTGESRATQVKNSIVQLVGGLVGPFGWDSVLKGPISQVAVGPNNVSLPAFCNIADLPVDGKTDHIDTFQNWSNLAYAYELSGNAVFLNRAIEMGGGSISALKTKLQYNDYGENSANQAALLWLCQTLGYF